MSNETSEEISDARSEEMSDAMSEDTSGPHIEDGILTFEGLSLLKNTNPITVKVLPEDDPKAEPTTWVLPKNLLIYHSQFFYDQLCDFDEGSLQPEFEVDEHPMRFEVFVQWLYLGRFILPADTQWDVDALTCTAAWALGAEIICPAFQDHAMLQLINLHRQHNITTETIRAIYQCCPYTELHKWAVWQHVADTRAVYPRNDATEWVDVGVGVPDFTLDVADVLAKAGEHGMKFKPQGTPLFFLITDMTKEAARDSMDSMHQK